MIYRAIPSWFVKVTPIVDELVANNEKTRWFVDSRKGCYNEPLNFFDIGFHRALVTIDSATGLLTLVTGTSHAIGIGVHPYPFGRAMTCRR